MVDVRAVVQQDSYQSQAEGAAVGIRANPRGEIVVPDYYLQLVLDGRVFNASNAVQETPERIGETARGADNVNPSLLLDVPEGTTVIPLEVMLDMAAGTSTDQTATINVDDGTRFSAGGVAITPINSRLDDPNTSSVAFYSGSSQITATANTDDNTISAVFIEEEATPRTTVGGPFFYWSARQAIPVVLIGPASLQVFVTGSTDDHDFYWHVTWAEIPTTNVT